MQVLIGPHAGTQDVTDEQLQEVYAAPRLPWLRVNMVSTVDGSATGDSGLTGSINNPADKRVYDLLRSWSDAILVGAGTARAEGYAPVDRPTVLVSRRGEVPERLRDGEPGSVMLATCGTAEQLESARAILGPDHVHVLGSHTVDLAALKQRLADLGLTHVLSEGGPHLLRDLVAQRAADELDATFVPRLVAGSHPRITDGAGFDVPLTLAGLLEEDGTVLGRWVVEAARITG